MATMTALVWMLAAGVGSAALVVAAGAPAAEVWWGLAGPLGAAMVSWVLVRRTFTASPARVTSVMMKAFAGKMLFFAAFVVLMLRGLALSATPFAVSFTVSFIGVYALEAFFLQRLFAGTR